MTLDQIGIKFGTGKSSMMCNYLSFYELLFAFTCAPDNLLEIGVQFGNSIKMWREYFPNANIVGIDAVDNSTPPIKGCTLLYGNAYDRRMVEMLNTAFDIIIDDGSHALGDQQFVVANYPSLLASEGILIIEDVASMAFAYKLMPSVPADCHHATVKITDLPDTILFLVWKKQ